MMPASYALITLAPFSDAFDGLSACAATLLAWRCKRICEGIILEISEKTENHPSEKNLTRVIELLSKVEKNKRPRKRSTLKQHISSLFQKKLDDQEIEEILDRLFIKNMVSEINDKLTYDF